VYTSAIIDWFHTVFPRQKDRTTENATNERTFNRISSEYRIRDDSIVKTADNRFALNANDLNGKRLTNR
jgi:hypothetical protein